MLSQIELKTYKVSQIENILALCKLTVNLIKFNN